jgi:hypothetical protein
LLLETKNVIQARDVEILNLKNEISEQNSKLAEFAKNEKFSSEMRESFVSELNFQRELLETKSQEREKILREEIAGLKDLLREKLEKEQEIGLAKNNEEHIKTEYEKLFFEMEILKENVESERKKQNQLEEKNRQLALSLENLSELFDLKDSDCTLLIKENQLLIEKNESLAGKLDHMTKLIEQLNEEIEKWQENFQQSENLHQEQIERKEQEKVFLMKEMRELKETNDRLTGHNNNKQKIQHHNKIKEENNLLKKEKADLQYLLAQKEIEYKKLCDLAKSFNLVKKDSNKESKENSNLLKTKSNSFEKENVGPNEAKTN